MASDTARPLHVRVAEALGWKRLVARPVGSEVGCFEWYGVPPEWQDTDHPVPLYDTDWAATGPLFERLVDDISRCDGVRAVCSDEFQRIGRGATLLEAVCDLILALHEAGKL